MTDEVGPAPRLVVEPGEAPADVLVGAISVGIAGAVGAGRAAYRATRPLARLVLEPPFLPASRHPGRLVESLARRGRADRAVAILAVGGALDALAPQVVARVLQAIPLTELIEDNVDIEAIVATIDLAEITERVIAEIDLAGITQQVIDEIDLPGIIRQSTGSMTTETVRGVRAQSYEADQAVDRVLGRMHLRRRARPADAPEPVAPLVVPDPTDAEVPT